MNEPQNPLTELLAPGHASKLYETLTKHAGITTLVVPKEQLAGLTALWGKAPACEVVAHEALVAKRVSPPDARVLIVADARDEARALAELCTATGRKRVHGLCEGLIPATLAGARYIFKPQGAPPLPAFSELRLVLVIATPRSGSSLLCDMLEAMGCGLPKEHIRQPSVDLFRSGYAFSEARFVENLARYGSRGGVFSTKLIVHFVTDLMATGRTASIEQLLAGRELEVLGLDRTDKVLQAVSRFLAGERKVWHLASDNDRKRLEESAPVPYKFLGIRGHYLRYLEYSKVLQRLLAPFPNALRLDYERDLVAQPEATAQRVARWLKLPEPGPGASGTSARSKLGDALNDEFATRFRQELAQASGPKA